MATHGLGQRLGAIGYWDYFFFGADQDELA